MSRYVCAPNGELYLRGSEPSDIAKEDLYDSDQDQTAGFKGEVLPIRFGTDLCADCEKLFLAHELINHEDASLCVRCCKRRLDAEDRVAALDAVGAVA